MGFAQFELQQQMKLRLHQESLDAGTKNIPRFSSQYVYEHLVKKELLNYCFHFEAILIYVRPILKWSPCTVKSFENQKVLRLCTKYLNIQSILSLPKVYFQALWMCLK